MIPVSPVMGQVKLNVKPAMGLVKSKYIVGIVTAKEAEWSNVF